MSLPLILFCSFSLILSTTHISFSLLVTRYISCGGLIVPNPEGKAHFADTAADVLYSTVISVRPAPKIFKPGAEKTQMLEEIAKFT